MYDMVSDGTTLLAGGTRPKNGATVQGIPILIGFSWETTERVFLKELGATSDCYCEDVAYHPRGFLMAVTSGTPGTENYSSLTRKTWTPQNHYSYYQIYLTAITRRSSGWRNDRSDDYRARK